MGELRSICTFRGFSVGGRADVMTAKKWWWWKVEIGNMGQREDDIVQVVIGNV